MALTVQQMRPMVPLPFLLSVLRRLEGATVIERLSAPPPSPVLSTGRGGDALVLALLNGDQALYQVGQRLEERGMRDLLQPAFTRASLHDYRCGHSLDARFAANLQKVFGASALKALEVDARPTPWLPQDTTTLALDGAQAEDPRPLWAPRPAYEPSKDGRAARKQGGLSRGVSGDSGIPLRLGVRAGNRRASGATPIALAEGLAVGLAGRRGIVADSKAQSRRPLGVCRERQGHVVTLVPRTWAVRQALEAGGQQQAALPL